MTSTDEADLEAILDVQDLDARIRRLQHQLDELPEQQQLDEAKAEDEALLEKQDAARVELERLQAEQRQAEGELDLLRQRRDAEQAKMYSGDISNPRELQSLRAEIDSTTRRIDEHESRVLEMMERGEQLENAVTSIQSKRDQLQQRIEDLTQKRDEAAQHVIAEKAELEVERDQRLESVPDELLQRYDEASERFRSAPFGRLVDGMCTGCRIELPVVDVNELLDGPPLAKCPQCQRPLVTV
ncbi:MAG: C4-type zinc ribbon domain-containing protein [Nitriliruptorales bacterium]|nr:C4-type zinc ribbon domain-containing protein [Nitriliruptorales bacterium]